MEKIRVLLNPSSGRGRSIKNKKRIENCLQDNGIPFDLEITGSEDHLRILSREAVGKYPAIVGVGGDTTFNIIAGEILGTATDTDALPTLGMLGTGSANDTVRSLGIKDVETLCRAIKGEKTGKMDVGCLRLRGKETPFLFLGTVSIGLGASVNQHIERFNREHKILCRSDFLGQILTSLWGIHRAFSKKEVPLEVTIRCRDTEKRARVSLLVFFNTSYYANGMHFVPRASPFDGLLDAALIDTPSFLNTLRLSLSVNSGRHLHREEFTTIPAEKFEVSSPQPLDLLLDGDIFKGVKEFEVSLIPHLLPVFHGGQVSA